MKTQNRPELKVGDRVRFRSDGEIGELNRSQNLNTEIFHTVKKICTDGRVYHEGGGSYAQVQFDICNDFSDIQVGDKVERYWKHWKYKITTDTVESVSENEFKIGYGLSISKADGIDGNFRDIWYVLRIVEKAKPKPLLADAKVGDLCKRRDGKWVQIDSLSNDRPCPIMCKSDIGGMDCFTLDGRNHNAVGDEKDIIHTEQLAPEGSAEWPVQRMKLGDMVCNSVQEFVGYWSIVNGYCFHAHSGHRCSPEKFLSLVNVKTGWQIYKEQFEVGDWVEHKKSKEQGRITYISSDNYDAIEVKLYYQDELETYTKSDFNADFRKLKPSEVVVDFGNGIKGTVRSCEYDSGCVRVISGDRVIAHIMTDILEQPMRELVERLLIAQEEK